MLGVNHPPPPPPPPPGPTERDSHLLDVICPPVPMPVQNVCPPCRVVSIVAYLLYGPCSLGPPYTWIVKRTTQVQSLLPQFNSIRCLYFNYKELKLHTNSKFGSGRGAGACNVNPPGITTICNLIFEAAINDHTLLQSEEHLAIS